MANSGTLPKRSPGRPRSFDMDYAVDRALLVFRERGYHAASLSDLGAAMELTPGSIYKAFSDKRAIFLAAFDRYTQQRNSALLQRLAEETNGLAKLETMLLFYAESASGPEGLRGCLVVGGATELATFDAEMTARVTTALRRVEDMLRDLIRLGQADASVPPAIDADACAYLLLCTIQGLRVVGKLGRSRSEAVAAVNQALRVLA